MESDGIKNLDKLADKEKLKLIEAIELASVTIIMTDADGNIQYGNPAFEKISGYSLKEAIGKNPRILKSGLTEEAVFEKMWKDITEGRAWEGEDISITFSCGIADASEFSLDTISTKDIICEADKRLYEAKDKGRNNIVIE